MRWLASATGHKSAQDMIACRLSDVIIALLPMFHVTTDTRNHEDVVSHMSVNDPTPSTAGYLHEDELEGENACVV